MEDRSIEGIFKDFMARRCGIIRALTTDVEEFCRCCDPDRENLCLYGYSDGTWKVALPEEEVPPEIPEPALGINFARDGMLRRDWLSLIAVHSDAWLASVAFFLGACLNRKERSHLFQLLNNEPTVFDVVSGRARPLGGDKTSVQSRPTPKKPAKGSYTDNSDEEEYEGGELSDAYAEEEDGEGDQDDTTCGICGGNYASNEFWICCDVCERWFHGKCVKVTPAKAQHMNQYKCPLCINKRPRVLGA